MRRSTSAHVGRKVGIIGGAVLLAALAIHVMTRLIYWGAGWFGSPRLESSRIATAEDLRMMFKVDNGEWQSLYEPGQIVITYSNGIERTFWNYQLVVDDPLQFLVHHLLGAFVLLVVVGVPLLYLTMYIMALITVVRSIRLGRNDIIMEWCAVLALSTAWYLTGWPPFGSPGTALGALLYAVCIFPVPFMAALVLDPRRLDGLL